MLQNSGRKGSTRISFETGTADYDSVFIPNTLNIPECLSVTVRITTIKGNGITKKVALDQLFFEPIGDEFPEQAYAGPFSEKVFNNATLYVPEGTTDKYKATDYWNKFLFVEEGEPGSSTQPEVNKCATPSISYADKQLAFSCETEGVEYHYTINDADIKSGSSSNVSLTATYEISVYATKSGYTNSDVATATLVWTDAVFTETTPSTPSSVNAIRESIPVLISAQNGTITVRDEQNGLPLTVYTVDGKLLGSATTKDGQASISTNLQRGEIAIVKVGSKSVKIKM